MAEIMDAAGIRGEWVGSVVDGRFCLLQWLDGSQDAGVFLTELSQPARKAVIKLVPADQEDAEVRMVGWRAATQLSHPNLMKVYTHGRYELESVPLLYVVTEFADEVLAEILRERPLTPDEAREMLGPALDALSYLHDRGFVHSRVKPRNIMAVNDHVKLSADGLSLVGAIGGPSSERTVYDAPETVRGSIRPAADIWSLGATLVEALTRRPPIWDRLASAEPVLPETIPEPFAAVARECLRTDAARRCTIEEIRIRLGLGTALSAAPEKVSKKPLTKRRVAVLFAALTVVLAGIGVWNVLSHKAQPPSPAAGEQNAPPAAPAVASKPTSARGATPGPTKAPAAAPAATPAPAPTSPPAATRAPVAAPAPVPSPLRNAAGPAPSGTTGKGAAAQQVQPDVVPSALKTITGTIRVTVQLTVDADGNVTDAALESAGPSKYFADKSLEAARQWKFKPAQVDGRPVPSAWLLHFQFKQSGIDVTPTETSP